MTAAGGLERHRTASASAGSSPGRGKGGATGETCVGFTTAQLEQLGAVVPLSDTLTREVIALRARVEYLNGRVDTELASRTPVIGRALKGCLDGERPEFPCWNLPSSPPMSRSPGMPVVWSESKSALWMRLNHWPLDFLHFLNFLWVLSGSSVSLASFGRRAHKRVWWWLFHIWRSACCSCSQ